MPSGDDEAVIRASALRWVETLREGLIPMTSAFPAVLSGVS